MKVRGLSRQRCYTGGLRRVCLVFLKGLFGMRPYSVSLCGILVKTYTAVVSHNLYRMWKMNLT